MPKIKHVHLLVLILRVVTDADDDDDDDNAGHHSTTTRPTYRQSGHEVAVVTIGPLIQVPGHLHQLQ